MDVYPRYQEQAFLIERRINCPHPRVLWGADGNTGFCFRCGATVKKGRRLN